MITEQQAELVAKAYEAGFTSQKELANFMAQVTHESAGLTRLNESFIYSKNLAQVPVRSVRDRPIEGEVARLEALQGHPEKLAEMMYGGRMGNNEPGDGYKYRGRGYIQLTGKNNYRAAQEALGKDFLNNPDLAATRENAITLSIWFWKENVHRIAPEDIDRATQIINIGNEGLDHRRRYFAEWQERLTLDVMQGLAQGEMRLPIGQQIASQRQKAHQLETMKALSAGDTGDAVSKLQHHLHDLGYTDARGRPLEPDGQFGSNTREAVTSFQRHQGLIADGIVGPDTWAALQEAARATSIAPAMASPATVEPPAVTFPQMAPPPDLDAATLRTLQQHLNTLHLADHRSPAVPITGTYDEATRSAVMAFQQTQGLPGTGLADPATRSLIDARATIAELQQNAKMHAIPMREAPLLEVSTQTPSTPSPITQSQPSVSAEMTPLHHVAEPPHGLGHPASISPAPSEAMTAPAIHHVATSNQDAFAAIQAQLREMQRQMEAISHQREQERAKEKEQDHARTAPYEPAPHAAHPSHATPTMNGIGHNASAMAQKAPGLSATDAIDPRRANHPLNGLYNELKTRIPDASEKRLLQFTATCHSHHISAENLGRIDLHEQGDYIRFCPSWPPGPVATVDLKTPAPEPQQCMAHIQQHDQQQVQLMAQIQAQVALTHAQGMQGPVLGGPSR